jgi:hypothetical protein
LTGERPRLHDKAVRPLLSSSVLVLVALAALPRAEAHFHLLWPEPWVVEDALGDPQKTPPCGNEGTPVLTGSVSRFRAGQTITVRWVDTVYHPGHFRISLSADRSQFHDPAVTTQANGVSLTAVIEDPPVAPVLLDNLFPRTAISGPVGTHFSQDVVLPTAPCAHCTLQVIQFMAEHGPPNYIYHHCADIEIVADGVDAGVNAPVDAASDDGATTSAAEDASAPDTDAGTPNATSKPSCSCSTSGEGFAFTAWSTAAVLAIGAAARRGAIRRIRRVR